ncbi:MAG: hypothetical protein JSU04_10845 [Bdellovibrionales bacterium]|nr:hypothetical protein [Bdellovibrionales bacterium]
MKWNKLSFYLTSASLTLVVLFGYQNCSQTHFSSDLDGAVLKAEAIPDDGHTAGDDGQVLMPPGDGVQPTPTATPTPAPTATPDDKKGGPKDPSSLPPQAGGKDKDKTSDGTDVSGLVECQMLHPNKKVVLSYELFVQHGNSTSVRVCMSENACLKLINAFAVQHSCSLDASAPMAQADAGRQCTEIFPGSKGTCHNASIVTDAQVSELLKKMGEMK